VTLVKVFCNQTK